MTARFSSFKTGIPVTVVSFFLLVSMTHDPGRHISTLVLFTGLITVILCFSLFTENADIPRWSKGTILLAALVIRLFYLAQPPTLSDDIFRYFVDGKQILSGQNPYRVPPSEIRTTDIAFQAILSKVNHPDLVTIYPPSAQIVFAIASVFGSITGFKAFLILMDLCVCFLIFRLLEQSGTNTDRTVLYAWHPLPVLETASSGHIDTATLFFLFTAVLFMNRKTGPKSAIAGFLFAASCLVKLFPVAFAPALFTHSNRRKLPVLMVSFGVSLAGFVFIFYPEITNGFSTLKIYATQWEFSGFLFRTLRQTGFPPHPARLILAGSFAAVVMVLFLKQIHPQNNEKDPDLMSHFYVISFAYLLLTPTLHPWYALYLTAFLPFRPGVSGIAFSWSVFLSYYILIAYKEAGIWQEGDLMAFLVFSAPVLAFLGTFISKRFFQYKQVTDAE